MARRFNFYNCNITYDKLVPYVIDPAVVHGMSLPATKTGEFTCLTCATHFNLQLRQLLPPMAWTAPSANRPHDADYRSRACSHEDPMFDPTWHSDIDNSEFSAPERIVDGQNATGDRSSCRRIQISSQLFQRTGAGVAETCWKKRQLLCPWCESLLRR